MPPDRYLKAAVFVAITLFIFLAPSYRVVTGKPHRALKAWMMYSGVGTKMCRVDFFQVKEGELAPIDRFEVLGYGDRPWWRIPTSVRRLRGLEEVDAQGRKLCRKLGSDADVRVEAWCGSVAVWKKRRDVERRLCTADATRHRKRR